MCLDLLPQTNEEFERIFLAPLPSEEEVEKKGKRDEEDEHVHSGTVSYPYTLDWREKGFVSPVSH